MKDVLIPYLINDATHQQLFFDLRVLPALTVHASEVSFYGLSFGKHDIDLTKSVCYNVLEALLLSGSLDRYSDGPRQYDEYHTTDPLSQLEWGRSA
jgi:hypothetical protein